MFLQEDLQWPFYLLFCGLLRRGVLMELIVFLPAIFSNHEPNRFDVRRGI